MGINYYLRRKPLLEQREELKRLIDESASCENFSRIKEMVYEMYGDLTEYNRDGAVIHLGKNSCGWKFLWNPNIVMRNMGTYDAEKKEYIDNWQALKLYDLTKESIRAFVMDDNYVLFDEYGEWKDKEEFLEFAFNKDGIDSLEYQKEYPSEKIWSEVERQRMWAKLGYTFKSPYQSDFYSDGLRFSTSVEFC